MRYQSTYKLNDHQVIIFEKMTDWRARSATVVNTKGKKRRGKIPKIILLYLLYTSTLYNERRKQSEYS